MKPARRQRSTHERNPRRIPDDEWHYLADAMNPDMLYQVATDRQPSIRDDPREARLWRCWLRLWHSIADVMRYSDTLYRNEDAAMLAAKRGDLEREMAGAMRQR